LIDNLTWSLDNKRTNRQFGKMMIIIIDLYHFIRSNLNFYIFITK